MAESAENDSGLAFALPPGTMIGHYTIRRTLGHGGFGITYVAEHQVIGRQVAIKEMYPIGRVHRDATGSLAYSKAEAATIAWALDKFEKTTTTLCGLDHPNIVRVYDYLKANETGYMIMELLDGLTLEDWLKRRASPPSVDDLMPVIEPVMDALAYVHGQGLIHRDVAPDNILVTDKGRPVLIDFGSMSRDLAAGGPHSRGWTTGQSKRNYTAPEQIRAQAKPTPEADVYSMGAVLYRALAGAEPMDGLERVLGQDGDAHEPLERRCPAGCPMPAARAIDKALALRPEDRFHGIAQLRDGMKAHVPPLPSEPEAGTQTSSVSDGKKRRPKVVPTTLATTLALTVAGFLVGTLLAHAIAVGIVAAVILGGLHILYVVAKPSVPAERRPRGLARLWSAKGEPSPPLPAAPSPAPSSPMLVSDDKKRRPKVPTFVPTLALAVAGFLIGALLTHAIIGVIAAVVLAGFHLLYVLAKPSKLDRLAEAQPSPPLPAGPSPEQAADLSPGLSPEPSPEQVAEPSPEPAAVAPSRSKALSLLLAQGVIGLAVFILARFATQSMAGEFVATFGAVLVFRLAVAEKPFGAVADGTAGAAAPGRRNKVRDLGVSLLVAAAIGIGLLSLDALVPPQKPPVAPPPVVVSPPDSTPSSGDGEAADDESSSSPTPAKPRARPCRRGKHNCRK